MGAANRAFKSALAGRLSVEGKLSLLLVTYAMTMRQPFAIHEWRMHNSHDRFGGRVIGRTSAAPEPDSIFSKVTLFSKR